MEVQKRNWVSSRIGPPPPPQTRGINEMCNPSVQMLPRGAERSLPTWAASAVSLAADMESYIEVH